MSTRRMLFAAVVLVLLAMSGSALWSGGTRSGTPPARLDFERLQRMSPQERIDHFRRLAEQQEEQAMKLALRVDERQWKVIEPKLKKVRACRAEAFAGIPLPFQSSFVSSTGPGQTGGGFAGGFSGSFQFEAGGSTGGGMAPGSSGWADYDDQPSEGERICRELQLLLQNPDATPEQIAQKVGELRKARDNGAKQWAGAQQELREVLNLHQQATLVMMGLLN
ncbi:MAG TPA: hypothetical protein VMW24_24545 [Sedimentisphaerales bacterium]|nr:hypothetical protein [Sedimentisphaerales bacterium]